MGVNAAWNFDSDRPIYTQLMEQIQIKIVSGEYPPGSKLPSVREIAAESSVNPNTVQRALSELEDMGLVKSQRTAGRFITEDGNMIARVKESIAREHIIEFIIKMKRMGFDENEIISLVTSAAEEME